MDCNNGQPPLSGNDQQNPVEMLDSITSFIRRYLVCDEYQLTILSLWVVQTWCYQHFLSTAYLDIRSPGSQSGKSRCLELLNSLCNWPWFATSASPGAVKERLLSQRCAKEITNENHEIHVLPPHTTLLDNCHHILGPSERQTLLAVLTSGTRQSALYASGSNDYYLFGPKAFAGNGRLPRSLAECCIPIVLRRKKPSETVARFNRDLDRLPANVHDWLEKVAKHPYLTSEKSLQEPPALPSSLTARQQDCAEPLLHVAHVIGGRWPEKARAAISAIFKLTDWSDSVQVLSDVRAWFHMKNNPEYMLTRDLLPLLLNMEQRPWSAWTRKSGRRLGALLNPFGIFSRNLTIGGERGIKGYLLTDFGDAWERYLPPLETGQPSSDKPSSQARDGSGTESPSATRSATGFAL